MCVTNNTAKYYRNTVYKSHNLQSMNFCQSTNAMSVWPTQVVVVHHGVGASQARPLLGEMISKLQQTGVFLQHAGDLHLHLVAQRLALEFWRGRERWRRRHTKSCTAMISEGLKEGGLVDAMYGNERINKSSKQNDCHRLPPNCARNGWGGDLHGNRGFEEAGVPFSGVVQQVPQMSELWVTVVQLCSTTHGNAIREHLKWQRWSVYTTWHTHTLTRCLPAVRPIMLHT